VKKIALVLPPPPTNAAKLAGDNRSASISRTVQKIPITRNIGSIAHAANGLMPTGEV
jgi:hypothetical protein